MTYLAVQGAVNFAICSLGATAVTLCLFTPEDLHAGRVSGEIELDSAVHRTGSIWHVLVTQMEAGLLYGRSHPSSVLHCTVLPAADG